LRQVGLAALHVLECEIRVAGIRDEMDALAKTGLL
jgi:hypothetical protein